MDLAGSERVWKSHVPDISRAKFFNLSLHHLESVVTALQKFHPRNTETDRKKKQTGKCLNRGSSAFLPQPQDKGAAEMPRVYGLLKSASTGQLGRRQGRQSPFGVGYNPCYIPYRNSLLTMVLQDSLGESTDPEGFLQLSVCYPFTPTSRQTQNSTQFSCFILLKMVKRIKNLKVLPKRFQLNLDERLKR